jgi:hypothetical protein
MLISLESVYRCDVTAPLKTIWCRRGQKKPRGVCIPGLNNYALFT